MVVFDMIHSFLDDLAGRKTLWGFAALPPENWAIRG